MWCFSVSIVLLCFFPYCLLLHKSSAELWVCPSVTVLVLSFMPDFRVTRSTTLVFSFFPFLLVCASLSPYVCLDYLARIVIRLLKTGTEFVPAFAVLSMIRGGMLQQLFLPSLHLHLIPGFNLVLVTGIAFALFASSGKCLNPLLSLFIHLVYKHLVRLVYKHYLQNSAGVFCVPSAMRPVCRARCEAALLAAALLLSTFCRESVSLPLHLSWCTRY